MTNVRMMELLKRVVREELPAVDVEGSSKTELLCLLEDTRGSASVVSAGYAFRELPSHPVLEALLQADSPPELLERWMRLERFAHTHHRTRILSVGDRSLVVCHVSLRESPIHSVDDLFIWGVLVALLERAGVTGISATLEQDSVALFERGRLVTPLTRPAKTDVVRFSWDAHDVRLAEKRTSAAPERSVASLMSVLRTDLLRTRKIEDVARQQGVSVRALQRSLRDEGVTFSELVHRARIERALELLDERRLSLTEIAFCVGFSDEAHFSRTFRRLMDVPPTGYRELSARRVGTHPSTAPR